MTTSISILTVVAVGFGVGVLGRLVASPRTSPSVWLTILVGLVAAFVGLFVGQAFGFTSGLVLAIQIPLAAAGVAALVRGYGRRRRSIAEERRAAPEPIRPPLPEPIGPARRPSERAAQPARASTARTAVFLSYRRSDTRHAARGVAERLRAKFGHGEVFMDVDSLGPGTDFLQGVQQAISTSAVVLVLIGDRWLETTSGPHRRRIDDPEDNVRTEIEHALQMQRIVLPVLVDDAPMPRRDELPASLDQLHRRNAVRVHHETWESDVAALIAAVARLRG